MNEELERLLDEARESRSSERIPTYRDAIANHGLEAVEPLTVWLDEPVLATFAMRTLERAAMLVPDSKTAVIGALTSLDREALPDYLVHDLDAALRRLGVVQTRLSTHRITRGVRGDRPKVSPGVDGRGYWAMRTSPWERPYIWAQAKAGRLRQGWGWAREQDLGLIADTVQHGHPLTEEQAMAWPSRRMLSTEVDGMQTGDLILAPNIPEWGQLCVFRLIGEYEFSPDVPRKFDDRFGHILPVELLAGPINRAHPAVADSLHYTLGNPSRLWSISPYGGDVERLAANGSR